MKSKGGFVQAYNAQAAVDAEAQIVAQDVTQSAVDCGQLVPMTDAIEATSRPQARPALSTDSGYCSEANLAALETRTSDGYVATGRGQRRCCRRCCCRHGQGRGRR
jgi:hypothetical protein